MSEVTCQRFRHFINLWLVRVLAVHLLLLHLTNHFLLLSILRIKPVYLVKLSSVRVTFANDLACQVYGWLKSTTSVIPCFLGNGIEFLFLLLHIGLLTRVKVFHVAVEHRRVLAHPLTFMGDGWFVELTLWLVDGVEELLF